MADFPLSSKDRTTQTIDGDMHIILPDPLSDTGYKSWKIAVAALLAGNSNTATGTFIQTDTSGTPNYAISLVHNLGTSFPKLTLFDSNGNELNQNGKVYKDSSDPLNILNYRHKKPFSGSITWEIKA